MRTAVPALLPFFRSELQLRLLSRVFSAVDEGTTAQDLSDDLGAPAASVHRELHRALNAGLIERDSGSRPHRYSGATGSPVYQPLRELLDRTVGVEGELREAFARVPGVRTAVIHGSWADGTLRPESDVDVLVIGTADLAALRSLVRPIGRRAGRRIDVTLFRPDEARSELHDGSPFLDKVARGPRVPLVGDFDQASLE